MSPRILCAPVLLLALVFGVSAASARLASHGQLQRPTQTCSSQHPAGLSFRRANGRTFGVLRWRPGPRAPRRSRYRVLRNGVTVGQTWAHRMRVNVSFGHTYRLRVWLILADGRPLICRQPVLKVIITYRPPSAPQFLSLTKASGATVRLSWKPASRGDGAVIGYRVLRDGAVYGQTRRTSMTIRVASNRKYAFTVLAIDANQRSSAPSKPVRVLTGHRAPSAPGGVAAVAISSTAVQLSWQPSRAQGRIVGYRVLRNGATVGQYQNTHVQLHNLKPSAPYTFAILAVDSLGYVSRASRSVSVRTADPLAPSAPASLLGAALNDTAVQLTWQPSVAAQGRIVGYRVLRDGAMIGQFAQTTATLAHLAPSTTYTFTVLAVDSYGAVSPPATSVSVTTANPTPSTGHVYTFLLADTGQSFQDLQAHYQEIGTVSPTYYDCNGSGNLIGANVPLITTWAQAREVKVLPRFNCQSGAVLDNILNNQALRQQWLSGIMNEVNANGYDGVTMDFEAGYPQDRNAYTAFVTDLAAQLHAENKTLALAVSAKTADVPNHPRSTFFDYNGLSAQADALIVMCWGVRWSTSAPGAQDDMTWVRQVVAYVTTLPRLNKYILGMQLYAMDWPNGGGSANPATAMEYQYAINLAASEGVAPTYDSAADAWTFSYTDAANVAHTVWYTDSSTEADRIGLARQSGLGGIGVWRLGREDQRLWTNPAITSAW